MPEEAYQTSESAYPLTHSMREMANAVRALSMDAIEKANSGHPGLPMGMADVATVLFTQFLKFDPNCHDWSDRDRFVLSAGHGSMLLYSLLYLAGYPDISLDDLKNFRQLGSKTAGHPEYGHIQGVEMTTGPLGQGIATAVGMALAEQIQAEKHGDNLVDHYTYALCGDGCLMEGISHEAIDLAGHMNLSKLIVLFDDNGITIDGGTNISTSVDQIARFRAHGWNALAIDGHDAEAIATAIASAKQSDKPTLIACKTIIGYGAPNKQGTSATHGAPLGEDEINATREALNWPHVPFDIPQSILSDWRSVSARGEKARSQWDKRLTSTNQDQRTAFLEDMASEVDIAEAVTAERAKIIADAPTLATRQSSQRALELLTSRQTNMLGGSADLTGSNGTWTSQHRAVSAGDFGGNYINYGVREHAMGAIMNGLALHGGFIPYAGTFLVFADYSRPALRLAALMEIRAIHVLTHDSIGVGEDGPTHQPVEHIASLRAIPNVNVFRPCDAVEALEAWECALTNEKTPSALCLTRQGVPTLRKSNHEAVNLTARGAYTLIEPEGKRDITLLATGSEVSLAVEAVETLSASGIKAAVVSMPCWELFEQQSDSYRTETLGTAPRVGIEAAISMGWDQWLGQNSAFIGMKGFGASGPGKDVFEHFNITVSAVVEAAQKLV